MDSYSKIADYIHQLEEMILTATNVQQNELPHLIDKHAEIAQKTINELDKMKTIITSECHKLETERIQLQSELERNKEASSHQLQQIDQAELQLAQMESSHEYVVNELKKRLEQEVNDNVQIRQEMEQNDQEYQEERNKVNNALNQKKSELQEIEVRNILLVKKMEEKQDLINDTMCKKVSMESQSMDLQEQTMNQRKKLLRQPKLKEEVKSANNTAHMNSYEMPSSEESDEEEEKQIVSPKPKTKTSILSLSLTPSKAGIQKFNPQEQTFIDWLNSQSPTFSYLKSGAVPEEQIVRMIILSLPPQMAWVGQNLSNSANLEQSKKDMLELVSGQNTTVKNFLTVTKGLQEHPLAFFQRLKSYLS